MNSPNSVAELNHHCFHESSKDGNKFDLATRSRNRRVPAHPSNNAARALPSTNIATARQVAHGDMLRKRYLNQIGIFQEQQQPRRNSRVESRITPVRVSFSPPSSITHYGRGNQNPSSNPRLCSIRTTTASMASSSSSAAPSSSPSPSPSPCATTCNTNTMVGCLKRPALPCAVSTTTDTNKSKKQVSFQQQPPTIHRIPSRQSYSRHTRNKLWVSTMEMRNNYARNVLEFRSENWDYRQCIEEHDFVWWRGHLVHPVHLCIAAAAEQHELFYQRQMLRQQQQQQQQHQYSIYGSPPSSYRTDGRSSSTTSSCATANNFQTTNLKNHFCRVLSAQQLEQRG